MWKCHGFFKNMIYNLWFFHVLFVCVFPCFVRLQEGNILLIHLKSVGSFRGSRSIILVTSKQIIPSIFPLFHHYIYYTWFYIYIYTCIYPYTPQSLFLRSPCLLKNLEKPWLLGGSTQLVSRLASLTYRVSRLSLLIAGLLNPLTKWGKPLYIIIHHISSYIIICNHM